MPGSTGTFTICSAKTRAAVATCGPTRSGCSRSVGIFGASPVVRRSAVGANAAAASTAVAPTAVMISVGSLIR